MSGKSKLQVVVVMLEPATVRILDAISDEELCSRSEVIRKRMERTAAAWVKAHGKARAKSTVVKERSGA